MGAVQIQHSRCAGLDVHKKSIAACVITPEHEETRTFGTMTKDILALSDWLSQHQVTHVAMESTGVYWKPVWNILEGNFELVLANAQHIKGLPGHKTDVKDCEWIADLLRHGLIRPSFVPDKTQRELRELTRYRVSLVQEHTREVNRLQHTLEGGNIKLAAVATDIMGKSAQAILGELLAGNADTKAMAGLAKGRMRTKIPQLREALVGRFGPHQRFLVARQLAHIDYLDEAIAEVTAEIEERMRPFEDAVAILDTIPGIDRVAAQCILAEIGIDMSRFRTHAHFSSWAKLCPGNNESAGKRKSSRIGHGNRWLRRLMVQVARAAARTKDTYFAAQYHRLKARHGANRAAISVAHSILITIYYLLQRRCTYSELGGNYFDERDREATVRSLTRRLERLGYKVTEAA